jgi:DNA-binding transcriptional MocR family regulator
MGSTDSLLYMRIAAQVRKRILTSRYRRYAPSQSFIMREFDCGKDTVQRAFTILRDEDGLIGTVRNWQSKVLVRPPYCFEADGKFMAVLARGERKLFCTSCWQQVKRDTRDGHVC